ncbi:MAG TPA: hypothetical protein PLA50_09650, partial [Bacteroidia bacterium]|nr:hypothetical protein [Bacteroidia bacterium]
MSHREIAEDRRGRGFAEGFEGAVGSRSISEIDEAILPILAKSAKTIHQGCFEPVWRRVFPTERGNSSDTEEGAKRFGVIPTVKFKFTISLVRAMMG